MDSPRYQWIKNMSKKGTRFKRNTKINSSKEFTLWDSVLKTELRE
jgi:hypothetical protein